MAMIIKPTSAPLALKDCLIISNKSNTNSPVGACIPFNS